MDKKTITWFKESMRNGKCIAVSFENEVPSIEFHKGKLNVFSPWRITNKETILLSSSFDASVISKLNNIIQQGAIESAMPNIKIYKSMEVTLNLLIVKKMVNHVSITGDCNDLKIEFSDNTIFETFSMDRIYEHWHFIKSTKELLISGPGKLWSRF